MKAFLLLGAFALLCQVSHGASLTAAGTLSGLTPPGNGTGTDVADLDAANSGVDGFVLFNSIPEGGNQGGVPWADNMVDMSPAYVAAIDGSASTSTGGWANYDDVTVGGNNYNTGGIQQVNPGAGTEVALFTFEVADPAPEAFRLGLIVDNSDNVVWAVSNVRVSGPGNISAEQDVLLDGATDLVQFSITGAAPGEVYTVHGTQPPGAGGALIGGVTFDPALDITDPTDLDGNNIGDNWEEFYFGDTGIVDPEGDEEPDGLSNLEEWQNLTNPLSADSDGDGLGDGDEVNVHMSDPTNTDSDGDSYSDGDEVNLHGTDPNDPEDFPTVPDGLISVDLEGDPAGALFNNVPVLAPSGYEPRANLVTGTWNSVLIAGHDLAVTDPSFPLVDGAGTPSGVTFSVTGTVSSYTNVPGADAITNDYLFVNAGSAEPSAVWELSGLSGLSGYSLFVYGGIARDMLFTVDTDGDGNLDDEIPALVDANGMAFQVTATGTGVISGRIEAGTADNSEANWGGFHLLLNEPATDTDGDGLSDEIEEDVGTDPNDPDSDGDGQEDGPEFNSAGTDPTNPLSVFKITHIRRVTGNAIELTWTSVPGKSYAVDEGTDLTGWTEIASEIDAAPGGDTTSQTVDSPGPDEVRKEYRVRVE